jgi:phytoene dehydrogenase-like protein
VSMEHGVTLEVKNKIKKGGMGGISESLKKSAVEKGVEIMLNSEVTSILTNEGKNAHGVILSDGNILNGDKIISNCTPYTTYQKFLDKTIFENLPYDFQEKIESIDYTSATFKINLAVDRIPNFKCYPSVNNKPGPQHRGTIHLIEHNNEIEEAYRDALDGIPSKRPVIEVNLILK